MPRIIKRYPNRKLYDTHSKSYVTLESLAGIIRQGEEIQVVDHVSNADVTSVVLTQIIYGLEKKRSGSYPLGLLSRLIQAGESVGALSPLQWMHEPVVHLVRQWLVDNNIPTRAEIQSLTAQVEEITQKLEHFSTKPGEETPPQ